MLIITDWDEHYENNRTRSMKAMRWVPVPNKQDGDGYTELLDHPNGAAHYGAWMAIVLVASKQKTRGTLVRESGTQVREHDAKSLARVTRIPVEIIEEAIPRLKEIGWLESRHTPHQPPGVPSGGQGSSFEASSDVAVGGNVNATTYGETSSTRLTSIRQEGAGKVPDERTQLTVEGKGKEGKGIEGNGKEDTETVKKTASPSSPSGEGRITPEDFISRWNYFVKDKPSLSKVMKLTDGRKKKLRKRLADAEWFNAFKLALNRLPLPGNSDGWQPTIDWLIRNEDNVFRITEGEFKWRAKDDPARQKLEDHRTKVIHEEHKRQLATEQASNRKNAPQTRQAIADILPVKGGSDDVESAESLLFGKDDDSAVNGAEHCSQ